MGLLEKIDETRRNMSNINQSGASHIDPEALPIKVSVVDGMAEVQALDKPTWVKTCSDLAVHFTTRIFEKYIASHEVRLIFDRLVTTI